MKGNGTKTTALYCRLSQDDGNVGDSMSVQSQKAILEKYAREIGKAAYSFYVDDGYSGTKDLSRLGRNYLESGAYIEVFFPQHHVRYIAVNDGVDSEQSGGLDITPFKNILNEFYSRDTSKKVKSRKHIRALEGKFMGTTAPFGYRKDPQDKNHLIVDETTAPTVRLLFSLALEGYGTNRIGKVLYERKIPKPSYYKQEFFSQHDTGSDDYWYDWKQEVITRILRNPVYKGGMYVHTTSKPTFKCRGRGYIQRADREMLEDVHEAVVTKEVWRTVQDIIDRHAMRAMKDKEKFINNVLLSMNESSAERSEKVKAEIDRLKKRNAELDQMYIRLCEDYSSGKLSELEKQHKAKSAAVTNAEQFTESLAQCAGMKKLTATVLNTLIEKIEVHNPVMVNGVKEQKLTVYYKFVGQID